MQKSKLFRYLWKICMDQKVTIQLTFKNWWHLFCTGWALCIPVTFSPEYPHWDIMGLPLAKMTQNMPGSTSVFLFLLTNSHGQTDSFTLMRKYLCSQDMKARHWVIVSMLTCLNSLFLQKCCAVSVKCTWLHIKHCVSLQHKVKGFYWKNGKDYSFVYKLRNTFT